MDKNKYKEQLSLILPEHQDSDNENMNDANIRSTVLEQTAQEHQQKINAATLAKIKMREKNELQRQQKKATAKALKEQERIKENIEEIQAIEESPEAQNFLAKGNSDLAPYSGTTKRDVVKLLQSLNINLNLNLTQSDTYNLLGCLLTCNERQLQALYQNPKIPVAIRTIIKRMLDDSRLGNIETIEKLWDRIFGKAPKATLELPTLQQPSLNQVSQGILPNTVVSRQAYMIIRDTIIGKEQ